MGRAVSIDVNRLVPGGSLTMPLYDAGGVLLLNAGAALTAELKNKIISRGVKSVLIDEADLGAIESPARDQADERRQMAALSRALDARVDAFVRDGVMQVRNKGKAVASQIVQHGATAYSTEQRAVVKSHQADGVRKVGSVLEEVASGGEVDVDSLDDIAASSIGVLGADLASTLSETFEQSNRSFAQHSMQMSTLAMALGIEMGFDFENVKSLGTCGLLADLGMARVPEHILNANRPLTRVEFVEIQKHSIRSAAIVEKLEGVPRYAPIVVYQVHECLDGSGYPRRRKGKSLHPFARILHVADAYTAMTAERPDRPPMTGYAAIVNLLDRARCGKVDTEVVKALLRTLSLFPVGSLVALSDGSRGIVLRPNGERYTEPVVEILCDAEGESIDGTKALIVDLVESELKIVELAASARRVEVGTDLRGNRD